MMLNDILHQYINTLNRRQFFGEVTLKIVAGEIIQIKLEEVLKLGDVNKLIK